MLYVQNYFSISRRVAAPFFPSATKNHAQSMSPRSCRPKRVDDDSRFYANITDFKKSIIGTSGTIGTTDTSGIRGISNGTRDTPLFALLPVDHNSRFYPNFTTSKKLNK